MSSGKNHFIVSDSPTGGHTSFNFNYFLTRMAEDVLLHGDFAEFKLDFRCEACQNRNFECILKIKGDRCIACVGGACKCIFIRTSTKKAPRTSFSWNQLIGRKDEDLSTLGYVFFHISLLRSATDLKVRLKHIRL